VFIAKLSLRRVVHRPDDSKFVGALSKTREIFAKAYARQGRLRRTVFTADAIWGFGLGIKGFVLRGSSGLKNENDRFRARLI
jgi:hypothetical protein